MLFTLLALACTSPSGSGLPPTDVVATPTMAQSNVPQPSGPAPSAFWTANPAADVPVPGTHVGLVSPPGFAPSLSFPGLEHDCGASILVTEYPTGYDEAAEGLTDEGLAGQGINVSRREEHTIDGRPGTFIVASQQIGGVTVMKIIVLTGTDELVAFLTGSVVLMECGIDVAHDVGESELGISFDPDRVVDPMAALRFTIEPTPPLKFAGVVADGAIYNTSGLLPSADIDEPVLIVSPTLGVPATGDLEDLARAQLESSAHFRDVNVDAIEEVTIAGRPSIVLTGSGSRARREGGVFVYLLLIGGEGDLVIILGLCEPDRRNECLEAFRTTTETFRPKA
jgi:hypothetical protein